MIEIMSDTSLAQNQCWIIRRRSSSKGQNAKGVRIEALKGWGVGMGVRSCVPPKGEESGERGTVPSMNMAVNVAMLCHELL